MKKRLTLVLAAAVLAAAPTVVRAEIGTIDDVPAATLLVPYFEVDYVNDQGINTLFTVNNASATAVLAHVTVWTDWSIPTLDFDVYLTGYDVQTFSMRDMFNGILPRTASAGQDPGDTISNKGDLSQDINFASCTGRLPYTNPVLDNFRLTQLRLAHTGVNAPAYGGCTGAPYGDGLARGYITVDTVTQCNLLFPSSPSYFATGVASFQNVLWGDYFYVDPTENFAQGETLVHIEACVPGNGYIGYVGSGVDCPYVPGEYTFYGRYVAANATDQREPLATSFATRFVNGGSFDGGTDLIVWRDSKTLPSNGLSCNSEPSWFPLNQGDVVAFDEQENPVDLCFQGDIISPPIGGALTCFPLETQRVPVEGGHPIAADLAPPYDFGWLYLNLNHTIGGGDPFPGVSQAWVTTVMSAEGRFSVGFDAIQLDNAVDTVPGGVVFIP